jgi:hypothetical protein
LNGDAGVTERGLAVADVRVNGDAIEQVTHGIQSYDNPIRQRARDGSGLVLCIQQDRSDSGAVYSPVPKARAILKRDGEMSVRNDKCDPM